MPSCHEAAVGDIRYDCRATPRLTLQDAMAARPIQNVLDVSDRAEELRRELHAHGQDHVLAFWKELPRSQQAELVAQIDAIDLDSLDDLIEQFVKQDATATATLSGVEPASYYPNDPADGYDADALRRRGEDMTRAGKVAAFTAAGGQGTRLGWNGPKGTFPGTPVTGKPLFRCFAEQIAAAQKRYGVTIPWYLMTSPLNDADTRAFFQDNNYFGLKRADVFMFPQGTMPSLLLPDGKLMLAEKHELAVNPDGHGGSIRALRASGAIDDMIRRGIEQISYFQVDNPLVRVIDPLFIGLHAFAPDSSGEISSKMVEKTQPEEKVGVFCRRGGRTLVIEYSDLPTELAKQREKNGSLRFNAGSIAIHIMAVTFVERLTSDASQFGLPLHRAVKKVSSIDPRSGVRVEPQQPNAVKLEMFVFDALPLAKSSIVYETKREHEFAPIKNAEGADSPATSYQLQSDYYGSWLQRAGVRVPKHADGHVDARVEISPMTAMGPADLRRSYLPESIERGGELAI